MRRAGHGDIQKTRLAKGGAFDLEYRFDKYALECFGWKKTSENTEEIVEDYFETHKEQDYETYEVVERIHGQHLGEFTVLKEYDVSERKTRRTKIRWENYTRPNPLTTDKNFNKNEGKYAFFKKIRRFFGFLTYVSVILLVVAFLLELMPGEQGLTSTASTFFFVSLIIYAILTVLSLRYPAKAKKALKNCPYRKQMKALYKDRLVQLDKDYKNKVIGYDAYNLRKEQLSTLYNYYV